MSACPFTDLCKQKSTFGVKLGSKVGGLLSVGGPEVVFC